MFGTSVGADMAVETLAAACRHGWGRAQHSGRRKPAVSGTVDPNGSATTYHVEYGADTTYGAQTTDASAGSGSTGLLVTATVTGLAPQTTYHYRFVADKRPRHHYRPRSDVHYRRASRSHLS